MQTPQANATDTTPAPTALQPSIAAATPRTCPLRRIHTPLVLALRYKRQIFQLAVYALVAAAYMLQLQHLKVMQGEVERQTEAIVELELTVTAKREQSSYQEPASCDRPDPMQLVARNTI